MRIYNTGLAGGVEGRSRLSFGGVGGLGAGGGSRAYDSAIRASNTASGGGGGFSGGNSGYGGDSFLAGAHEYCDASGHYGVGYLKIALYGPATQVDEPIGFVRFGAGLAGLGA